MSKKRSKAELFARGIRFKKGPYKGCSVAFATAMIYLDGAPPHRIAVADPLLPKSQQRPYSQFNREYEYRWYTPGAEKLVDLPESVEAAIRAWHDADGYAGLTLGRYLRTVFSK